MGISENSHEKQDKETQSPLLNIFKEIMTREKDDPEKRNLLNVHREDKKKRQYSGSRNKIAVNRLCESSSSEHRKRSASYKVPSSTEQRPEVQKSRNANVAYPTEKKDSWWCWFSSKPNVPTKKEDDSCSCVSCALKKIISSEYACVGCLLLLFTISIVVAFLVVFKNVPNIGGECKELDCKKKGEGSSGYPRTCKECGVADSERLKRKIDMLSSKKMEDLGINEFEKSDNKGYEDLLPGHAGNPGVPGIEFGPSFRELSSVDDTNRKYPFQEFDISTILYSDMNTDTQSNEKLREFYKKLVQTDAQIKSLKKISRAETAPYMDDIVLSPERSRRSLKLYHYPKRFHSLRQRRSLNKIQNTKETDLHKVGNKTRLKRFGNQTEQPTGFIIEKKKLLVQYKPAEKQRIPVKKCQHAPKDSSAHEKQMMHPFYKNTQRLDELLDKFLNKNLPEIMSDPFGVDEFFKHDKPTKLCKHPKPHNNVNVISTDSRIDQIPKPKFQFKALKDEPMNFNGRASINVLKLLKPECTTKYEKDFFNHEMRMISSEKKKLVTASPSDFEVMLSVSTIMNPDFKVSATKMPYTDFKLPTKAPYVAFKLPKVQKQDKNPKMRRLMQLEPGEEEEALGYEDFKEVLTDDMDNHDEMEKSGDRKKRDSVSVSTQSKSQYSNPPFARVQNPNWKGAMPLYPDEINSMMTNKDANKVDFTKTIDKLQVELFANQRRGSDLSDVEYVEDYLANKYDKLVQQAQAYSDYGVLDGKKESRNDKDSPTVDTVTNHKIQLSRDDYKASLFGKIKRGRVPRAAVREYGNKKNIRSPSNEFEETRERMEVSGVKETANAQDRIHFIDFISDKSEGIRIEIAPTTKIRDDAQSNADFLKMFSKHVKIKPYRKPIRTTHRTHFMLNTALPSKLATNRLMYNSTKSSTEKTTVFKNLDYIENDPIFFDPTGAKRRLLANDGIENSMDFRFNKSINRHGGGNEGYDSSNFHKLVHNVPMNNDINDEDYLKEFMEKMKKSNIKIYSTPNAFNAFQYSTIADTGSRAPFMSAIKIDEPIDSLDSVVTVSKSEVKTNDHLNNNFLGKILMTVNNPEFEAQNFKLLFDIPLVSKDPVLMTYGPNFPYDKIHFDEFTDITVRPEVTDLNAHTKDEDYLDTNVISKRSKRNANVTANWIEQTPTQIANEDRFEENNETDQISEAPGNIDILDLKSALSSAALTNNSFIDLKYFPMSGNFTEINRKSVPSFDASDARASIKTKRSENSNENMTLSDFFSLVSNWFKALDGDKVAQPRNVSSANLSDSLLNSVTLNLTNLSTITTESAYPMYDSDMIENIGHRSRVLLSVEYNIFNVTNKTANNTRVTNFTATPSDSGGYVINVTIPATSPGLRSNRSTTTEPHPTTKKHRRRNKAIVKRHADDSNLIFWNDIYDDEYGIQPDKMDNYMKDKFDNSVRDKHSVKDNDFIKRSGRWVQNKIKKFANKINPHSDAVANVHTSNDPSVHSDDKASKERVPRSNDYNLKGYGLGQMPQLPYDRMDYRTTSTTTKKARESENNDEDEDYPEFDPKSLFAALSLNMKEICQKAAKAIQQIKSSMGIWPDQLMKTGAQGEARQGTIANALMQQLVRLLTDLVDYQVQQKTCAKLPPDLETFLDWLINSKEDREMETDSLFPNKQHEGQHKSFNQENEELIEQLQDRQHQTKPVSSGEFSENHDQMTDKDRAMACLQSVKELLMEYDKLSVLDKSKLIGVKTYLMKQMEYLKKLLSALDMYQFLENHDILRDKRHSKKHKKSRGNLRKFIKSFGKHTKTTTLYDEAQVTDVLNRKTNEETDSVLSDDERLNKRNLKDVYYRAVAEAKKFSTAKGVHKKGTDAVTVGTSTMIVIH